MNIPNTLSIQLRVTDEFFIRQTEFIENISSQQLVLLKRAKNFLKVGLIFPSLKVDKKHYINGEHAWDEY